MRRAAVALAGVLLGGACADRAVRPASVVIDVIATGQGCTARRGAEPAIDAADEASVVRFVAAILTGAKVYLRGTVSIVRFRCIGGLIFALQRRGVARVGFIFEPPAAPVW